MFKPTLEEFESLADKGNLIPVALELVADEETPVSAFHKLSKGEDYGYLLESVEGGEHLGRYSFLSFAPREVLRGSLNGADPLQLLKDHMAQYKPVALPDLPRFWGGAVGYMSYDVVKAFEKLPKGAPAGLPVPDYLFLVTDTLVVFDHLRHTLTLVACAHVKNRKDLAKSYHAACRKIEDLVRKLGRAKPKKTARKGGAEPVEITSNVTRKEFLKAVEKAKEYIAAGDVIQVVISQRFGTTVKTTPFELYRALRLVNPSPYMYYMHFKDFDLVGSSPEILVRKEDDEAETRPIAGTRPRGRTLQEDTRLERELREDPKERAEHLMLVDLGRNDLGRVCSFGTVKTEDLMTVERYSHVMHLVSTVKGKIKPSLDAYDLFRACFPAGTVSGAPKIRAMEIIGELEKTRRGPYAGAVGYFSFTGNMDMAITIRTMVVRKQEVTVQTGAGIVADSVPEKEFEETRSKAAALFAAVERAERGL